MGDTPSRPEDNRRIVPSRITERLAKRRWQWFESMSYKSQQTLIKNVFLAWKTETYRAKSEDKVKDQIKAKEIELQQEHEASVRMLREFTEALVANGQFTARETSTVQSESAGPPNAAMIASLEDQKQKIKMDYEKQLNTLKAKHEEELLNVHAMHDARIADIRKQQNIGTRELVMAHKAALTNLESDKDNKYATLQLEHDAKVSEIHSEIQRLTDDHDNKCTTLQREHDAKVSEMEQKHTALQCEHDTKISEMHFEIASLKDDHDIKCKVLQKEHDAKVSEVHSEMLRLKDDHEQVTANLRKEHKDSQLEYEERERTIKAEHHEATQERNKKHDAEKMALQAEQQDLQQKHDTEKSALQAQQQDLQLEYEERERKMKAEHHEATQERNKEHDAEKMALQAQHAASQEAISQMHTAEKQSLSMEHQKKIEDLHSEFDEERKHQHRRMSEMDEHRLEQQRHMDTLLQTLAPLQNAMESGNVQMLSDELERFDEMENDAPDNHSQYGMLGAIIQPVAKLAREKLLTWRAVAHVVANILVDAQEARGSEQYNDLIERLFRAIKDAQMTGMDIVAGDPEAPKHILEALSLWHQDQIGAANEVQLIICERVANCEPLEGFDFADFEYILRMVDVGNDEGFFLPRAKTVIEDEVNHLGQLPRILGHLQTVIFFLKYFDREDLQQTYDEFRKANSTKDPLTERLVTGAQEIYPPGWELLQQKGNLDSLDTDKITQILIELRLGAERMAQKARVEKRHTTDESSLHDDGTESMPVPKRRSGSVGDRSMRSRGSMMRLEKDSLGFFREIFYQWAVIMKDKFDCLVLPHHTQVVCLQIFRQFMETDIVDCSTLVAEVSTGEGKSMIISALAIYAAVVLKKQVHVVVDDVILLERDFQTFQTLFEAFEVMPSDPAEEPRSLTAICCSPSGANKIDRNVDICYCEARHVQSFYASIAKSDCDFAYENRILILDEVDALVIDEKPNEPFVYPNNHMSTFATNYANHLQAPRMSGKVEPQNMGEQRVAEELTKAFEQAAEWKKGQEYTYSQDHGKNVMLQKGRAVPTAWSLTLEALNFKSGLSTKIHYQERLFVMSRPRVFQRYHRIVGLSGSVGNMAERNFLGKIYGAKFVRVPPFLTTCRGPSPFHNAEPGNVGEKKVPVYVENNAEAQLARIAEVVFEEHLKVPVLIIARDREQADSLVVSLQKLAASRGLGNQVVQSLSYSLHESNPLAYKKNLNLSTQPVGRRRGVKMWRITVTDPRGGRGTDYRVDDGDADTNGGLLLVVTYVPKSIRDWTQYLGRTARQDRKGHYCGVLDKEDYAKEAGTYGSMPQGLAAISTILDWGNTEAAERIKATDTLYHQGLRVNELCEVLHSTGRNLIQDQGSDARCRLVQLCQFYHGMQISEMDTAAQAIGLNPSTVPTQAHEVQIDKALQAGPATKTVKVPAKKGFAFCLDQSSSMLSSDATANDPKTGQPKRTTRFDASVGCITQVYSEHVAEGDCCSLILFADKLTEGLPMTEVKAMNKSSLAQHLGSPPQPKMVGGTALYDAVAQGLNQLDKLGSNQLKFLVCLTDGDDNCSGGGNRRGEAVGLALSRDVKGLNLIIISVGKLASSSMKVLQEWIDTAEANGGSGQLIAVDKAAGSGCFSIGVAFEQVAASIQAETAGSMEC